MCVSKANEAVAVDGEVAAILKCSRFKEDFTCQPAKAPAQSCGVKPKVRMCPSLQNLKGKKEFKMLPTEIKRVLKLFTVFFK